MTATFYTSETAKTRGTEYCAFYMGRNSIWNGDKRAERSAFKSEADYSRYLDGRRSAGAEEALDADTEWNSDEGY